jgi:hypothetical protein
MSFQIIFIEIPSLNVIKLFYIPKTNLDQFTITENHKGENHYADRGGKTLIRIKNH